MQKLDKLMGKNPQAKTLHVGVYLVNCGNFNDGKGIKLIKTRASIFILTIITKTTSFPRISGRGLLTREIIK